MRIRLLILSLMLLLCGCRTTEIIRERHHYSSNIDSVYIDCTDTLYYIVKGDTVTIREVLTRTEYRYRMMSDTILNIDTVVVTKKELVNSSCGKARKNFFMFGLIIGIIIIFALYLLTKKLLK